MLADSCLADHLRNRNAYLRLLQRTNHLLHGEPLLPHPKASFCSGQIWSKTITPFGSEIPEQEQKLVWATQGVPKPDLFEAKVGGTAWKSKPSWYIVGKKDHTVHPDLERFLAKRMGATTYELDSSHVPMLSQPERVIDVIRTAAKAASGKAVAA